MPESKQKHLWQLACVLLASVLWAVPVSAQTSYYVDPDWAGGTKNGAAATPWNSLNSGAWTTINAALASADVTVYFSAREASSDTSETTTTAISVLRTDTSSHRLTLDGKSYYNTNDASPSWSAYSGTHLFEITASVPVATPAYTIQSNITIHGFRLIANQGQILFWWAGDNVIWEDIDGSSTGANSWGPGFYFKYRNAQSGTCPTPNDQASCYESTNLVVRRNYIHDTFGEALYVGGCEDVDGCYALNGLTVENNTFVNPGIWPCPSCEADALDIKDGVRNIVVRGNTFVLQPSSRTAIVTESGGLFERNYFVGSGAMAIYLSTFENNSGATRDGTVVRNNVIVNSGGNGAYSYQAGIYVNNETGWHSGGVNDTWTNLRIYNNSIYQVTSGGGYSAFGIIIAGGSGATVTNNVIMDAATRQLNASAGSISAHSNNLFYSSTPGAIVVTAGGSNYTSATITDFEATALSAPAQFLSTSSPYTANNFRLQSTSAAIGSGTPVASFSNDYFGSQRSSIWDRGAIQSSGVPPLPPTNIKIIRD